MTTMSDVNDRDINLKNEYEKALIFFNRKTIVHVSTREFFTNGLIMEISKKFFVIKDRKDGSQRFIFFNELLKPLQIFKEVNNDF